MADPADGDPLPALEAIKNSLGILLQLPQDAASQSRMVPLLEHMNKQISTVTGKCFIAYLVLVLVSRVDACAYATALSEYLPSSGYSSSLSNVC